MRSAQIFHGSTKRRESSIFRPARLKSPLARGYERTRCALSWVWPTKAISLALGGAAPNPSARGTPRREDLSSRDPQNLMRMPAVGLTVCVT